MLFSGLQVVRSPPTGDIVFTRLCGHPAPAMMQMMSNRVQLSVDQGSPFCLDDDQAYQSWRAQKLAQYPALEELVVEVENPLELSTAEKTRIEDLCRRCNTAIYKVSAEAQSQDKELVHQLGIQLGLSHLDNNLRSDEDDVTSLQVTEQVGNQYIPYTNRPLSWHADGYYNLPEHQVRAFILYCVRPSAEGGENSLIDHEQLYIRLRDENPALIIALMHPQAMMIPPNIELGSEIRGACIGPVFSVDAATGSLHMRYSARTHNIEWRDDELTQQAATLITELLENGDLAYTYRLNAGEGVVCNNVLHKRSAFSDSDEQKRLMYRARYFDRISHTGLNQG